MCLGVAALLGASFYFFPPGRQAIPTAVRGRFILLFVSVAVFCASWILDEHKTPY